ncbi:MAG: tetratricopeptide repeat protein [Bacteroidales bacterium]|nr:tetratricopeptide repeat protein [Bacteroidales bacterium]MBN2821202.1 tetratricopeptide repeat protein [Bacteroidales bacterium]
MENNILSRAHVLVEQKRYEDAEREIRNYLATDPQSSEAFKLLAIVFLETKRPDEAETVLRNTLNSEPNDDFIYYLLGRVSLVRKELNEASKLLNQAVALNPMNADYYGVLSSIKEMQKEFKAMLNLAEEGLSIDPENLLCLNNRSTALIKLGRKEEAFQTADKTLELDPENPMTHANYGWTHLEKGDHKKALEHFMESLRIDPNSQYAQVGMMQALKAKYLIYRMFLKYAFWMSNMKGKMQWLVIIGFLVIIRLFRWLAAEMPETRLVFVPVIALYILFAISTWVIGPLSNLFLRFNFYGKYLLSQLEKLAASFTGVSLLIGFTGVILYLVLKQEAYLALAAFGIIMMIPLGSMFSSNTKKGKTIFIAYTATMFILGAFALAISFKTGIAINGLSFIFILMFVGFQFLANFLLIREK